MSTGIDRGHIPAEPPTRIELEALANITAAMEQRMDRQDEHVSTLVGAAVRDALREMNYASLTDEERAWIRLGVEAQGQRVKLRQAVIEKTLTGLVWAAVLALAYVVADFFQHRGLRLGP